MKTSNILLTGLFGSITITTLAMMADIAFDIGTPEYTQYDQKVIPVRPFQHLEISNTTRSVAIETSDTASIELFTIKGNQMPSITYDFNGDTLIINQLGTPEDVGAYFKLKVPGNVLQGITGRHSEVVLNDYSFQSMSLVLDDVRVWIQPRTGHKLGLLSVNGRNKSSVDARLPIDTLTVNLDQSSVFVHNPIRLLQGSLINTSTLGVRSVEVFEFTKDTSSRLDHWN